MNYNKKEIEVLVQYTIDILLWQNYSSTIWRDKVAAFTVNELTNGFKVEFTWVDGFNDNDEEVLCENSFTLIAKYDSNKLWDYVEDFVKIITEKEISEYVPYSKEDYLFDNRD